MNELNQMVGRIKSLNIFLSIAMLIPVSAEAVRAQEITVSAAISLKEALTELGKTFEARQKGVRVRFNFGASGDLARQISAGPRWMYLPRPG